MPIYEYRCTSCQAELEKLQKISDPPLIECPECGKSTLVKLISASSFRLKGSGWYETDFKTGNRKNGVAEEVVAKADKDSGASSADDGGKTVSKDGGKSVSDSKGKNSDKKDSTESSPKAEVKSSEGKASAGAAGAQPKSG